MSDRLQKAEKGEEGGIGGEGTDSRAESYTTVHGSHLLSKRAAQATGKSGCIFSRELRFTVNQRLSRCPTAQTSSYRP